ncbi:23S rRNA (adenine(2503)-C(2))-methyltransferase RlmN [Treponema sp. OMZ 840]|uniref:23S rRNA (adenine(2503)-C(2))-methyltransferase RlmN n=1 Tax=Treponema sp. OMZ 840 TaxID=244313 RepID=UPI003D942080
MTVESPQIALSGLLPERIAELIPSQPPFRGMQIFKWIASGAQSLDQMTDIPLSLRHSLAEKTTLFSSSVSRILEDTDGTTKLQIDLGDGLMIETVLLFDGEGRKTACLSSQAGCAMGCTFCKTGSLGFARNLSAAEIVEQFLYLEQRAGKLQNIVFMGMGEPLLNLEEVRNAVCIFSHKKGRALSLRRITLSTCGIIDGIYDLADRGPAVRLAVSLTTADPDLREELMPIARSQSLEKLAKAIQYYSDKTGHRCTLEAALLKGVNTGKKSAHNLINFARRLPVHINLIPWNKAEGLPYQTPSAEEIASFYRQLKGAGLNVTIRTKRGSNIAGACGQLGKTQSE